MVSRILALVLLLSTTAMAKDFKNGSVSPTGDKHPGTISHEDSIDGATRSWVEPVTQVPQSIAWVSVGGKWKPVVKIVALGVTGRIEITQYGPDGERLQTTYQAPAPQR